MGLQDATAKRAQLTETLGRSAVPGTSGDLGARWTHCRIELRITRTMQPRHRNFLDACSSPPAPPPHRHLPSCGRRSKRRPPRDRPRPDSCRHRRRLMGSAPHSQDPGRLSASIHDENSAARSAVNVSTSIPRSVTALGRATPTLVELTRTFTCIDLCQASMQGGQARVLAALCAPPLVRYARRAAALCAPPLLRSARRALRPTLRRDPVSSARRPWCAVRAHGSAARRVASAHGQTLSRNVRKHVHCIWCAVSARQA